ncbi:MAG: DUF1828 domain-containing protein [Dehalococcoidia bacterium]|nr:DUF1828 domain-containing protein [Dehalococcoidia bacterium]MDW8120652.1 DUF1828 domain-containing protein [Chloroflexota bacterium]
MEKRRLEEMLCTSLCRAVRVNEVEPGLWVIDTPFAFPDGDHFVVAVQQKGEGWVFTDHGHTLFHLADLEFTIDTPARQERFGAILRGAGAEEQNGEIRLATYDLGKGLLRYLQLLQQVVDLLYLRREEVRRIFHEDVARVLAKILPSDRVVKNYTVEVDQEGAYTVDFKIEREGAPIFAFAIANNEHCDRAAVKLYWYERQGISFIPLGIFENEGAVDKRSLRRFAEVCPHRLFSLNEHQLLKILLEEFKVVP